ncbi:MAG: hypothetical protein QM636_09800 [Rhizobium sp.]
MLFGQSLFQSVLDRLDTEEEDKAEKDEAAHRIRGLNVSFVATVPGGERTASARPGDAYADNLGEDIPPPAPEPEEKKPEPPAMPEHLGRTSREEVAAELAITAQHTLQHLHEKRRAFAKANHPDSVAPPFRDQATMRMMIANQLIDEAIRRLPR